MNPALEGVNLFAYGHSYMAMDFFGQAPQSRYINRVGRRLGMNVVNRATGGWRMQDVALDAIGTRRPWTPGTPGVVVIDATTNDVLGTGQNAANLRGYEHSLRALLHYVSLSGKRDDDHPAVARVRGFLAAGADFSSGHNWQLRRGEVGSATVSWPYDRVVVGFYGLAGDVPAAPGFEVRVDGAVAAQVSCSGQTLGSSRTRGFCPIAVPLDLGAGTHSIQVRPVGGAASFASGPFLDFFGRPSAEPPRVVVVRALHTANATRDADYDAYSAIIDRVAAEFLNVVVCDAAPGWAPATMIGLDGIHPNSRGNAHIADALEATLATVDFSPGVTP